MKPPRAEEVIQVLHRELSDEPKTIKEMFEDAGVPFVQSAHSASLSRIWQHLGEREGLILREKVKRRCFKYRQADGQQISKMPLDKLVTLYKGAGRVMYNRVVSDLVVNVQVNVSVNMKVKIGWGNLVSD